MKTSFLTVKNMRMVVMRAIVVSNFENDLIIRYDSFNCSQLQRRMPHTHTLSWQPLNQI